MVIAFLGLKSPQRRELAHDVMKEFCTSATTDDIIEAIDALWCKPEREYKYVAIDMIEKTTKAWLPRKSGKKRKSKNETSQEDSLTVSENGKALRDCFVRCIRAEPWWDTIDMLAPKAFGELAQNTPTIVQPLLDSWSFAEHGGGNVDVWERRVGILYMLRYRGTDHEEKLFEIVRARAADQEFWIRKAIGWILRDYRRTAPESVDAFVEKEEEVLSPLSVREAWKHK